MLECVVIAKDLAYRGRVNAAIINNDALYAEKQGVFSVIREGDLDIYKILGTELEKWRKGISSELTRARREQKLFFLTKMERLLPEHAGNESAAL